MHRTVLIEEKGCLACEADKSARTPAGATCRFSTVNSGPIAYGGVRSPFWRRPGKNQHKERITENGLSDNLWLSILNWRKGAKGTNSLNAEDISPTFDICSVLAKYGMRL